jgi:hypothetical protein
MKQLKSNVIDGEYIEITPQKKPNFISRFIDRHTHKIYMIVMIIGMYTIYDFQKSHYQWYVDSHIDIVQENHELKFIISSCECKECKIWEKTVRSMYCNTELDSMMFKIN